MGFTAFSSNSLAKQAATAVTGYALANVTGTIISWTAPNDGNLHRFMIFCAQSVMSAETGGTVLVMCTNPDGTAASHQLYPGGSGTGDIQQSNPFTRMVKAGTTVSITQTTALTGGAATMWAEIWGS